MLGALALRGGAETAVPELLRVLQEDRDDSVRSCAALSLGKIGDRRVVPTLLRLADDKNTGFFTREGVVSALGEISDPRATDILVRIVKNEIDRADNNVGPWREAIVGLHKLGSDQAVEAMVEAATKCPETIGDDAIRLLWRWNNPDALERLGLVAIENQIPRLREAAIIGLGNFHSDRAVAILAKAYQQKPNRRILLSMGIIGRKDAVPLLLGVVLDKEAASEFRFEAARAMAAIGESSVPSLLQHWANVKGDSAEKELLELLWQAMSGISDKRLLPAWKDVFERMAPTAREYWNARGSPGEWRYLLHIFYTGMLKVGKDGLPYLEELRQQEQHDDLRSVLVQLIEEIKVFERNKAEKSSKSTK